MIHSTKPKPDHKKKLISFVASCNQWHSEKGGNIVPQATCFFPPSLGETFSFPSFGVGNIFYVEMERGNRLRVCPGSKNSSYAATFVPDCCNVVRPIERTLQCFKIFSINDCRIYIVNTVHLHSNKSIICILCLKNRTVMELNEINDRWLSIFMYEHTEYA